MGAIFLIVWLACFLLASDKTRELRQTNSQTARVLPSTTATARSESDVDLLAARKLDKRIEALKDLRDQDRVAAVHELALQIRRQPLRYELALASNLAIDGEENADQATLQEIANLLTDALRKLGTGTDDRQCYQSLAELVVSAHVQTTCRDARLFAAIRQLATRDRKLSEYDFSLQDLQGHTWNLKHLRGRVVLVNFWETWCPPCQRELPALNAIDQRFKPRGLVVLGITFEEPEVVKRFIERHPVSYPVLIDHQKITEKPFAVTGFPYNFVFDRGGSVVAFRGDRPSSEGLAEMLKAAGLH